MERRSLADATGFMAGKRHASSQSIWCFSPRAKSASAARAGRAPAGNEACRRDRSASRRSWSARSASSSESGFMKSSLFERSDARAHSRSGLSSTGRRGGPAQRRRTWTGRMGWSSRTTPGPQARGSDETRHRSRSHCADSHGPPRGVGLRILQTLAIPLHPEGGFRCGGHQDGGARRQRFTFFGPGRRRGPVDSIFRYRPPRSCVQRAGLERARGGQMRFWGFLASLVLLFAPALAGAQANPQTPPAAKPSANAGKHGQYRCKTSRAGYDYNVYVPAGYSEESPAGLHLFFHGQNGQGGAGNFGTWATHFLDRFNLIGINMQYEDGDNAKDTEGKVKSAQEAVAQTIADYKIVVGRGVVSSFSGGGLPHALFYDGQAKGGRGSAWPFCHAAMYSSNYRTKPAQQKVTPMTFSISVGQGEWTLASLGADGLSR